MAATRDKLFAVTRNNLLWWRDPVVGNLNWCQIGQAINVVAMAGVDGKLFAVTSDDKFWSRDV